MMRQRPKVIHVTTVHDPLDVRIFVKECQTLASAGFRVTLLAPGDVNGVRNGVNIQSLGTSQRRAARLWRSSWVAFISALNSRARIVHVHDPELLPVAIALKICGRRVVYDVHEEYKRKMLHKSWLPTQWRPIIGTCVGWMESVAARLLDAVVAATPAIARQFPEKRTWIVRNYPERRGLSSRNDEGKLRRDQFVIYAGAISEIRGAVQMVDAMAEVRHRKVRLVLAGKFASPELKAKLEERPGWSRTDYVGWQPREQILALMASAQAGLVISQALPENETSLPIKMFEYMAQNLPVIASRFALWERIIEDSGSGLLVAPDSPEEIGAAIDWLLLNRRCASQMGQRGREAVEQIYNWEAEAATLLEVYERVLVQGGKQETA